MDIQKQFEIAFNQLNYTVINLKHAPDKFQEFLELVPEFFIERQDFPASQDEAKNIISNLPSTTLDDDKILLGINKNDKIIGFFEILLHFPSQEILSNEDETVKGILGDLNTNRFTIGFLVIHTEYRNQGIGGHIITLIEKILYNNGYSYSHLIVNQNNISATRFYIKHGYLIIKLSKQVINNKKQSCIFMQKCLG